MLKNSFLASRLLLYYVAHRASSNSVLLPIITHVRCKDSSANQNKAGHGTYGAVGINLFLWDYLVLIHYFR